jgi:hypothetical protein
MRETGVPESSRYFIDYGLKKSFATPIALFETESLPFNSI